ncbi:diphosphomevalonate decarboxylase [Corynebacterium uberis]|uniref:diphosphomevalonate decarboxylase n=1 Tax=Corynebacterium TaxID=1716 RepID=UPI001D0B2EEA|nr:diphosphomevalonate decarboxylase [Corynebacterium uberis]MCZ9308863.1 diphosphomevalonate decarboxylase [Corynebacterium sp. c6VSa_13]UDL74658.1 diphosphomevalonate decarboxylase [Corynebacterium uberis]UDL76508.1 diphosphomevalonate decarboxylase [Corynebacterium uberis]UDL78720.1 diphosphomevalonate decarboxylase [Corynebacterium uberis]UDL80999.1 diphosphomevalonate decarboxylase [Corynebacterium uberis]
MRLAATATAHANIALIKYWGKADEQLIIPRTPSLSLTLAELSTTTRVEFGAGEADVAELDGVALQGRALERVVRFVDLVRARAGITAPVAVTSHNTVPTAAGLASSASGFAALAAASAAAAGLNLDPTELSRLARRGSGSACRSIFGGLAYWEAGDDDATSFARPVTGALAASQLAIVVLVIDAGTKAVSSREAMARTVANSPVYEQWVRDHATDMDQALTAIAQGDLEMLGEAVERNALGMHATMRAATPPVDYLGPDSQRALEAVRAARAAGFAAWATMDAGPNVKVLTSAAQAEAVGAWLRQRLLGVGVIVTHAGRGVEVES